jgi:hypothetical protein
MANNWRRTMFAATAIIGALVLGTDAIASTGGALQETSARFDPISRETQVQEQVSAHLCVSFRLPRKWRLSRNEDGALLHAEESDEDLEIRVRSSSELQSFPQADIAAREAAALQQTYETMIGKPAQATNLQPTGLFGVSRWSATWVDANLASASRALVVETYIVDLKGAALELTLSNTGTAAEYRDQIARLLSSLRIGSGAECHS